MYNEHLNYYYRTCGGLPAAAVAAAGANSAQHRRGSRLLYVLFSSFFFFALDLLSSWQTKRAETTRLMFEPVVTAAISFVPVRWDLDGNLRQLVGLIRTAAAAAPQPQLILAPEGVLEGYVVQDIYEGGVDAERMRSVALTDDSPAIRELRGLAVELGVCLAFGYAEQVGDGVRNAAAFVDFTGAICGKFHKLQLAEGYVGGNWYNELGESGRAFDTPLLICNDRWNPDLARLPVLDGAALLLIPSFGSCSPDQDLAVLARARENGVAILEANVGLLLAVSKGEIVGREDRSDRKSDYSTEVQPSLNGSSDPTQPGFVLLGANLRRFSQNFHRDLPCSAMFLG